MKIIVKHFYELTIQELYNILQLRSEVFVVEQECIYQDIDGKDQKAVHIFFTENNHCATDHWVHWCLPQKSFGV